MSNGHPIDHANGQQPGLSVTERAELERLRSRLPFPMEAVTSAGGAWSIEPNVLWIGGCDPEESASLRDLVAAANAVPALLSALSAAEALLTEARAWGEEQRRQASEHYERAETAEAALSEAREALRECAALFDGQGGTLCDGHTTGDGNGGCTWHHSPSCRKCSVLARARRVLASTVEGNSKLDANSETNRE